MARKSFSKFQQTEILGNQDYECNICKIRFSKTVHPQFDHINGENGDNRTENGQAICSNCHDSKSRKENAKRSLKKKDDEFVKYCCFCGNGDDKGDSANKKLQCANCESIMKIMRYDSKTEMKKITTKKQKEVQFCPHCGDEFGEKHDSNQYWKCQKCDKGFAVSIIEFKKSGWW